MTGHSHQGLAIKAPVLHELTRKLHRVPFHIVNSGGLRMFHRGEHVLKPMAKLMKKGLNLFKTHQTWDVSSGWGLVANQIGHRVDELTLRIARPVQTFIHPGSTSFAGGSAEGIEIKRCEWLALLIADSEKAHILMPDRCFAISRLNLDGEQAFAKMEKAIEHLWKWKPWTQLLLIEVEPLLTKFLRPIAHIPGAELIRFCCPMTTGTVPQFVNLLFRDGEGCSTKFFKKLFNSFYVVGHF